MESPRRWRILKHLTLGALLGALLGGVAIGLSARAARFRRQAEHHASFIYRIGVSHPGHEGAELSYYDTVAKRELTSQEVAKYQWHARMSTKYAKAARHPWLHVADDLPEPP